MDLKRWDFALRPGAGMDFYFNEHWSINFEVATTLRAKDWGDLGSVVTDNAIVTYGAGAAYHF